MVDARASLHTAPSLLQCPERIAADRIAETVESGRLCYASDRAIARAAVEAISAAGLVIITAERAAQLLDTLRLAQDCIAGERAIIVECDTLPDADGRPDESTMDELTAAEVAKLDAVLDAIRVAIGGETAERRREAAHA